MLVAPGIGTQFDPCAPQRSHWYVKWIGTEPVQVPVSAVSVELTSIVPVILGETVFRGCSPVTGYENPDVALPLP